jgi:hypothetical protein
VSSNLRSSIHSIHHRYFSFRERTAVSVTCSMMGYRYEFSSSRCSASHTHARAIRTRRCGIPNAYNTVGLTHTKNCTREALLPPLLVLLEDGLAAPGENDPASRIGEGGGLASWIRRRFARSLFCSARLNLSAENANLNNGSPTEKHTNTKDPNASWTSCLAV